MKVTVKGDTVVIELKLHKPRESTTGKSMIRYSSGGFKDLDGHSSLRANVTVIERK